MEQRITMITLGVKDLATARAFYLMGLGWTEAKESQETVCFIKAGGVVLGLYQRDALAEDAKVDANGSGFRGVALAYNTRQKEDVDRVLQEAVDAGGKLIKAAENVFWGGYSGYFADPDGHLWEVAHNPFIELNEKGHMALTD